MDEDFAVCWNVPARVVPCNEIVRELDRVVVSERS